MSDLECHICRENQTDFWNCIQCTGSCCLECYSKVILFKDKCPFCRKRLSEEDEFSDESEYFELSETLALLFEFQAPSLYSNATQIASEFMHDSFMSLTQGFLSDMTSNVESIPISSNIEESSSFPLSFSPLIDYLNRNLDEDELPIEGPSLNLERMRRYVDILQEMEDSMNSEN